MKKISVLMALCILNTSITYCTNWIVWFKNNSPFTVEGQSTAHYPNYIEIQGDPRDYRANTFKLPGNVQFQSKNFPLPWNDSNQALYLTVHTQTGPRYYKLYEHYNSVRASGAAAGGFRVARVDGPDANTSKTIEDNWELTVVINKQGVPEIRGKNFEILQ